MNTTAAPAPEFASPVLSALTINLNDGQDETRSYLALDWLIRTFTPAWLDLAGLTAEAAALRDLQPVTDPATAEAARSVVRESRAAAGAAAVDAVQAVYWNADWDAARDAAWDATGAATVAAGDSSKAVAWAATGDSVSAAVAAAWNAAWAVAVAATGAAAGDAAVAAAGAALLPTVETLQVSALDLLDRMIDPSAV